MSEARATCHELKVWARPFAQLWLGYKTFELRKDDRGYRVGDDLTLREWDELVEAYTGRVILARVTNVLSAEDAAAWGRPLADGWVILSLCMPHLEGRFYGPAEGGG